MDSLESDIMDYARFKGGWFTNREIREHLNLPQHRTGHVSKKLKSLVRYGFLVAEVRYMDPSSRRWYTCIHYRDAEVEG